MTRRSGVFISHIPQETGLPARLEQLLEETFGEDFVVHTSADFTGQRAEEMWFKRTLKRLWSVDAVIALISLESLHSLTISFESGVGEGAEAPVIPVLLGGVEKRELPPPFSFY